MQPRRYLIPLSILGFMLLIASSIWLATAQPASAQCGSAASSCKNCHEVQGEKPVNNDGTSWHQSHAFGDFCYICHGGNSQATDETAAHTGMIPPLSDVQASCQQCHTNDLMDRAQVYATALGVTLGDSSSPQATSAPAQSNPTAAAPAAPAVAVANTAMTTELDVNDPNLVDYVQNYDEVVLHKTPTNWGNVLLLVMIGLIGVGGGSFIIVNEKWVKLSFGDTKKADGEYPSEVVDMLPAITKLNPRTRKSLKKILDKPDKTKKVLDLIDEVVSNETSEE
ncbi:MAG: hypothetical protein P8Z00_00645 [Anaerolineales bacterium]